MTVVKAFRINAWAFMMPAAALWFMMVACKGLQLELQVLASYVCGFCTLAVF